ncbi:MAG: ABC transporter ATP-binding protein [Methanoculleaceae archaeon]
MITAREIVKEYNGYRALDRVSFTCSRSRILGIVGHNGAGKTTLLKIAAGLIAPTSGDLLVDGTSIWQNPELHHSRIGYLPEEARLYESMTVERYLTFFGEIYGLERREIRSRMETLLDMLSLEEDSKRIGELSKGMRQKVAIARSLIHDPDILIYDEPTSGLDPMTSRFIIDRLQRLRDAGKTILYSAHNLYQVEEICDQVMILRRGRVAAAGRLEELREEFGSVTYRIIFSIGDPSRLGGTIEFSRHGGYYLTTENSVEGMNRVTALITSRGGSVERVESHYPTLEEMLVTIGE